MHNSPPPSEQALATEMKEQLSTIVSHIVCLNEKMEWVHEAIERLERLERLVMAQFEGNQEVDYTSHDQSTLLKCPQSSHSKRTASNLNPLIQGASTSSGTIASPLSGTLTQSPSSYYPAVNRPLTQGQPPAACHTENHATSPPAHLNVPKTPNQVAADLASSSESGPFYIVTRGREPGIYTDWPKAEGQIRGLRRPVYCKKHLKTNAIHVYTDAYVENRLEHVLE